MMVMWFVVGWLFSCCWLVVFLFVVGCFLVVCWLFSCCLLLLLVGGGCYC